ncbi:MAG: hypothetical protein JMN24_01330 [gamma proteobacterium endosymbiont of Lamellibrachia anaximandri]|nr:hypothetical protein [gamma proteobacterium endosymbiont of Lamellibrachia anaximandri]MBL3617981.1 hypothetical protein [gamma proteobacterium endosymbiont of Lamellibrachia anaximandri]
MINMVLGETMPRIMKCPGYSWLIFSMITLWTTNSRALSWDELTFYPTKFEAVVDFDGTNRRKSGSSRETEWRAGVRVEQDGYALDPGIALFHLDIEPMYTWGDFESSDMSQENSGELLNYLFQLNLLQGTPGPVGFDLSTQRSTNYNTGSLGSRNDNVIDTTRATVNWKNPAFPTNLTYEERSLQEEFRSRLSSAVSERDETLKRWAIKGRSSKLDLRLEHKSLDDQTIRDQDYEIDEANISHRLPWGNDSRLRSRFDYYDRTGFNANKRLTFDEFARIQHTPNLYSRTSYHYHSIKQNIKNIEHRGIFELNHQLYKNLKTKVHTNITSRNSDNADEDKWLIGLDSKYSKQDLFGASVMAGLGGSYQETDRVSNQEVVEVIDESHIVPLTGSVILNQRFILTGTIIVTDDTGALVYAEGSDYIVIPLAGDLTQLQTIPGGRIDTGDTLLVSYKAEPLPSQTFSTIRTNFNLGIDLGWVRFSHSDNVSDDKLMSGADESFLNDTRNTITDIEFRTKLATVNTVVGAARRFTLAGGFESTTYTSRQLLSWTTSSSTTSRGIQWNLNATQSFTEQESLDTDLYRIDLSAHWYPFARLSIHPTLGTWKRYDTGDAITGGRRDDEFITAGVRGNWRYRELDLSFNYHHDRRTTSTFAQPAGTTTQSVEDRLMFTLRRRFR